MNALVTLNFNTKYKIQKIQISKLKKREGKGGEEREMRERASRHRSLCHTLFLSVRRSVGRSVARALFVYSCVSVRSDVTVLAQRAAAASSISRSVAVVVEPVDMHNATSHFLSFFVSVHERERGMCVLHHVSSPSSFQWVVVVLLLQRIAAAATADLSVAVI